MMYVFSRTCSPLLQVQMSQLFDSLSTWTRMVRSKQACAVPTSPAEDQKKDKQPVGEHLAKAARLLVGFLPSGTEALDDSLAAIVFMAHIETDRLVGREFHPDKGTKVSACMESEIRLSMCIVSFYLYV
jgi:hypothetical protein